MAADHEISYITDSPMEYRGYPGDKTIRQWHVDAMRERDKGWVRRMSKDGTLASYLDSVVTSVRQHGLILIAAGYMPEDAWRQAVRVYVYDIEED